ncbi:MAG: phosphoenolpyruvate--protein phosphotransferase [Gracilimonas sp.]
MEAVNTNDIHIKGLSAGTGIAIGEAVLIISDSKAVDPSFIKKKEVKKHKAQFSEAKETLLSELKLMSKELKDSGSAEIIDTQLQIIEDPDVQKNVFDIIENKLLSVDFALYQTFSLFIERLKESGSELFRQRIVDLEEIRDRYIALVSDQENIKSVKKGSIIIAREISPTELVSFYEDGAVGLVMEKGGVTSHAAIISKSLGLPCIVSANNATREVEKGDQVILDSAAGILISHPAKTTLKSYQERIEARAKGAVEKHDGVFATTDGCEFKLLANIEFEAELPKVVENDAKGVGLLRTESLLFGHRLRKSEEEQVAFYSKILSGTTGPVTIRLFDIGGDKSGIKVSKEANPFLGWRGIRLLLDEKELLRNQLRAIYKVSGEYQGRIKILVPMISVLDEVHKIKKEMEKIRQELISDGVEIDEKIPLGLMVEVPSVALSAYQFGREVDFFSIGTNDLTQYTMAVDRGNERICDLFQHYHPSVLKLIKLTVEGADKAGIEVSVCGELAGNKIGAACLLGFGIREFSMLPYSIPVIQELLNSRPLKDFQELAKKALELSTAKELEEYFKMWESGN